MSKAFKDAWWLLVERQTFTSTGPCFWSAPPLSPKLKTALAVAPASAHVGHVEATSQWYSSRRNLEKICRTDLCGADAGVHDTLHDSSLQHLMLPDTSLGYWTERRPKHQHCVADKPGAPLCLLPFSAATLFGSSVDSDSATMTWPLAQG